MREYVTPTAAIEVFAANDYVATCTSDQVTYNFKCTAPASDNVYVETNGRAGLQKGLNLGWWGDKSLLDYGFLDGGYYHPCGITHSVTVSKGTSVDNIFHAGYLNDGTNVVVWYGPNNDNVHCQIGLDGTDVEVVRS